MNLTAFRGTIHYLYCNLVAAYIIVVLFTNLPLFINYLSGSYIAPKFYYLAIALCLPLALFNIRAAIDFIKTPFALWIIFVTCVYGINLFLLQTGDYVLTDDEHTDLINRFQRQSLVIIIAFAIFYIEPNLFYRYLKPVVFIVPAVIILDFYLDGLLDPIGAKLSGRAQGTYKNANLAAEACAICAVLMQRVFRGWWLLFFYMIIGLATILTFSRSGIGAWLILLCYLFIAKKLSRKLLIVPILIGVFYSALLLSVEEYLLVFFDDNEGRVANMINRLSFFSDVGIDTAQEDSSGAARVDLTINIFLSALQNPIFGYVEAPLANFGKEAHNLILELWYTFGVAGLVMYGWIAWLLMKPHGRKTPNPLNPYFVLFLWISFFDHSQLVVFVWVIFYALTIRDNATLTSNRNIDQLQHASILQGSRRGKRRRRRRKHLSWR